MNECTIVVVLVSLLCTAGSRIASSFEQFPLRLPSRRAFLHCEIQAQKDRSELSAPLDPNAKISDQSSGVGVLPIFCLQNDNVNAEVHHSSWTGSHRPRSLRLSMEGNAAHHPHSWWSIAVWWQFSREEPQISPVPPTPTSPLRESTGATHLETRSENTQVQNALRQAQQQAEGQEAAHREAQAKADAEQKAARQAQQQAETQQAQETARQAQQQAEAQKAAREAQQQAKANAEQKAARQAQKADAEQKAEADAEQKAAREAQQQAQAQKAVRQAQQQVEAREAARREAQAKADEQKAARQAQQQADAEVMARRAATQGDATGAPSESSDWLHDAWDWFSNRPQVQSPPSDTPVGTTEQEGVKEKELQDAVAPHLLSHNAGAQAWRSIAEGQVSRRLVGPNDKP